MKRTLLLTLGIATIVGLSQFTPLPTRAQSTPAAAPSPSAVVHLSDFAFKPVTLNVIAGDTVQFVNDDSTAHTVTATDKSFDSGNLDPHKLWSHTFTTPGSYAYACAYHSGMKGQIVVAAAK